MNSDVEEYWLFYLYLMAITRVIPLYHEMHLN